MPVTKEQIRQGIQSLGLSGKPVCLHSSLGSFGRVEGGADSVLDAFLEEGCTLLVPTFSYHYTIRPRADIPQNEVDWDYYNTLDEDAVPVFDPEKNDITRADMGAVPAALLGRSGRRRGRHPTNSFAALGPLAEELTAGQTPMDVYAPLRTLCALDGLLLLAGVNLTRLTAIHYAEQMAGRNLFVRWAKGPDGAPVTVLEGSCSEGFQRLAPCLAPLERQTVVGDSLWRLFPAREAVVACAEAILEEPEITHCADPDCERCNSAVLGGPVYGTVED